MDNLIYDFDKNSQNKDNINFLQKFLLALFIIFTIVIVFYQLMPSKTKNELETSYYKIKMEIYWVNIVSDDTIESIFNKNCSIKIQNENCKNYIVQKYFKENEFEKLYEYCKWKKNGTKIYCLENTARFKTIEQGTMLFMGQKDEFNESEKQIIDEINSLISN